MSKPKLRPPKDKENEEFIQNCRLIHSQSRELHFRLGHVVRPKGENWEDLDLISQQLPELLRLYSQVTVTAELSDPVHRLRREVWASRVWQDRLTTLYLSHHVISLTLAKSVDNITHQAKIIQLVTFFNELLSINLTSKPTGINVVQNTCPILLQPLRKFSITKILQVLAQKRAEQCGQRLVDILQDLHREWEHPPTARDREDDEASTDQLLTDDDLPSADNSSMEIYRTLTRDMTPDIASVDVEPSTSQPEPVAPPTTSEVASLDRLLYSEDCRLTPLLTTISQSAPELLGQFAIKQSKQSGEQKVRRRVRQKVLDYYSQVLWGEVGSYLDHILLWWGPRPMGTQTCQPFRDWLINFMATVTVPSIMKPGLHSLLDALTCHVTSTSWDQRFRKALVAAGSQHGRHVVNDVGEGTHTGHLFVDVLSDLVSLSNSCEGPNWTIADLEDLPIVEQIPILHRLDHSIHTARQWVSGRARLLSNAWNMEQFFRVTQSDVSACLQTLAQLKFANQVDILNAESSVHVVVCVKMRAKLISEVKANLEKLQGTPSECEEVLAKVCRTVSLANLHMMFPDPEYWRQRLDEMPQFASNYVEDYLEEVLRPVLTSTTNLPLSVQQRVGGMVLNIMGEAWLDHIYAHQIKFSEWGALQLLTDFGAVPTWLLERVNISGELRKHLLNTEVLRRCEGVGRLLLRRPGERIPMNTLPLRKKHDSEDSSPGTPETMPAEMYVPNQEQWLKLRAPRPTNPLAFCCGLPS